jgi:hypothetical protein
VRARMLCHVCCALCAVRCALCAVRCALCAVHCALCAVRCVLCALCFVLCAVCCVLCAVWRRQKRSNPEDIARMYYQLNALEMDCSKRVLGCVRACGLGVGARAGGRG